MSDISVLTQEYQTTSELSETLDRVLIELKKVQTKTSPATSSFGERAPLRRSGHTARAVVASGQQRPLRSVTQAQHSPSSDSLLPTLAAVLEQLAATLDFDRPASIPRQANEPSGEQSELRIPLALAMRLRDERRGDLEYLLEDIRGAAHRLKAGAEAVTNRDMTLLDNLASVADEQATALYRRLMRR